MRWSVPRLSTRCEEGRRGAVTVWLVVTVLVIVSIVGLGMDGGRMFDKRRHAQATADAAALAGAAQGFENTFSLLSLKGKRKGWVRKMQTPSQAALDVASANGFTNDGVNSIVTVNNPPTSGAFAGQSNCVEVIVQYNLSNTFGAVFTKNKMPVKARAVALGRQMPLGMLLLRPSGADAFLNNSLAAFTLVGNQMYINSTDPWAYRQAKAGIVTADAYNLAGNFTNPGGAIIVGKMRTGTRQVGDPLRQLDVPDRSSLTVQSTSTYLISKKGKGVVRLQPGIYQGGINLDAPNTVKLDSGIYYLEGGGLQVTGSGDLTGTEVTIYNTSGSSPAGPITITAGGKVALTAPSSGTYQGITIFQDRAVSQPISVDGSGAIALSGMIYAPAAAINLTGAIGVDVLGGAYIASSMTVAGIGVINVDLAGNPPPMPEITLVE